MMKPLVILGCIRSGTTVLHELLLEACPQALDLTDDDFESRFFWQHLGLKIGSRSTGTYCCAAGETDVSPEQQQTMQKQAAYRSRQEKVIITKNPHLLNKIPFVADVWPEARFVLIVRQAMSVVASKKLLFQNDNMHNEDYPPFVHYWPEDPSPCWWTIHNDRAPGAISVGVLRREAKKLCRALGLKKKRSLTAPGRIYGHEPLSSFALEHPDLTRYYPGGGFARIPEAWLTLNANACRELCALESDRWMVIDYSELVAQPRETIQRICQLADIIPGRLEAVPARLDASRANKWQADLTEDEQRIVIESIQGSGGHDLRALSNLFGHDPSGLAETV
jgi:hypothetical protein